ncbi:MAG: hypothetical protein HDT13_09415 [Butyrivibrio sp.]|nr:hypothetical protein [Butyrivibrio sp.]
MDFPTYSVNSIQGTSDYAAIAKAKAYLGDMGFYDSKLEGYNDELKKALKCFQNAYLGGQTYNVENGIPSGLQNKIQDIGAAYYTNLTNSRLNDALKKLGFNSTNSAEAKQNFARIWTFLEKGMGCNKYQIAGIMGNIMQESNFSPKTTNSTGAVGILQWKRERRGYLESYASKNGYSSADNMGIQLAFFRYEVNRIWGKGDIDENAPNSDIVEGWKTIKNEYKSNYFGVSDYFKDHIEGCTDNSYQVRRNYSSIIYQAIS